MNLISLEENGLDPREAPGWEGAGRRKRKRSSVVSKGSSRKLRGCLPSTLVYLPAAGETRCGNDRNPGTSPGEGRYWG